MESFNNKEIQKALKTRSGSYTIASFEKLNKKGLGNPYKLPFSTKILLESALRNCDNYQVTVKDINTLLDSRPDVRSNQEIAFKPGRVLLQDFTGVPCLVDLAALRSGMKALKGDIKKINPQVPCDLIIDHSLQIDAFGSRNAIKKNISLEFRRNKERYQFLKWGQKTFKNFSVIPPATGIIHQINLEYIAKGVLKKRIKGINWAFPDSLVGTDSHTTMINGLGIIGWGVGGIEAEAVMLGEPIYMLLPDVIGFELSGQLSEGVTATDLVLTVVQMLRQKGVVGKFVEFYGDALANLSLPDRATISNMCPEYGATIGIFPVDKKTLEYYKLTGRSLSEVDLIERYMKEQGLFYEDKSSSYRFKDKLELDISTVKPCLAGPRRPQDRILLSMMKSEFHQTLINSSEQKGFGINENNINKTVNINGEDFGHGAVIIASITSCTNTSNPSLLIAAGLLAKKAVSKGLKVKNYVKTSFIPGSQVAEEYLSESGLLGYLENLRFHIVGYGCGPCIGNSGPIDEKVIKAINENNFIVSSVLSGNRNFEGRISPYTKTNYLASPPLVVAYALAGTTNINLTKDPIGKDKSGNDVYLKDIWPGQEEINQIADKYVTANAFRKRYKNIESGSQEWRAIKATRSALFKWNKKSTYIQEPPFFKGMTKLPEKIIPIENARVLIKVGDSITTDHISPAGSISPLSPAGKYLLTKNVKQENFNNYGSRRGNDRIMTRGTFANIRLRNQLVPGTEGSWTIYFPTQEKMSIFDASELYKRDKTPLVVLAGKEYGTGSSRDWAAKGPALLGIKVVIAQSYERIHRSNLAGMGILPLEFKSSQSADSLGLNGDEIFDFKGIVADLKPCQDITVIARSPKGRIVQFNSILRLDTPVEIDYFRNGGILQTVLRKLS